MPKSRTRRRRQPPRTSIPTALTPRAEWDEPTPDETTPPEPATIDADPAPERTTPPGTDVAIPRDVATEALKVERCSHCGGLHVRACPRVRRIKFHTNGTVAEVEFWKTWDDSNTLWPEVLEAAAADG